MVFVKNLKFLYSLFLGKMNQAKMFMNVLHRKNAFPDHKKIDLRRPQNLHFFKTASPWLLSD